ncbi:MAG: DNA polymerase I, partial [Proteobacteria bacterium]
LGEPPHDSTLLTSSTGHQSPVAGSFTSSGLPPSSVASYAPTTLPTPEFKTIRTVAELSELLRRIEDKGEFAVDTETTSLNPREAVLVGVSLAFEESVGYYIPINHRGNEDQIQIPESEVLALLKPVLENPLIKKVGQNLKYDGSIFLNHGILIDGFGADTMVADYVLDPEGKHGLDHLAKKVFDYSMLTYEAVCGKGKDQIPFDLVTVDVATRYSGEDAWMTWNLWRVFQPRLAQENLMQVFAEVDMPLVPVLMKMEWNGVSIDVPYLEGLAREFNTDLLRISEEIQKFTNGPINLNSPKQLGKLLFEDLKLPPQGKTKTGFSTDASVLEVLAPMHPVPEMILENREVSKLLGTYVDPLPQLRDKKTAKIHAGFNQTVAATGRLSSSDPNLQNIPIRSPRGERIRRAFIPSPGNVLLSADYSQIELRLLAEMSGDPELVDSFKKGEDVHRRTASEIFSIDVTAVNDEQRAVAKAINFGLMYGKSAFGLAQELNISRGEAKERIDRYFTRYSGVKSFLDSLIIGAKEKGYVTTLLGRKRVLKDIHSKIQMMRSNAERMAMNTPIQGTAADLVKLAMIRLQDRLERENAASKLIIQVHDEVVLDVVPSELVYVKAWVKDAMENAFQGVIEHQVPFTVNIAVGSNWMDLN